jgi:hypothetical protein
MKKNISEILSLKWACIAAVVIFFLLSLYAESNFNTHLREWTELYRRHLTEDGMNNLQISTIINAVESSAQTSFRSLSEFYRVVTIFLILGITSAAWKIAVLEKELKIIKEKLDV